MLCLDPRNGLVDGVFAVRAYGRKAFLTKFLAREEFTEHIKPVVETELTDDKRVLGKSGRTESIIPQYRCHRLTLEQLIPI